MNRVTGSALFSTVTWSALFSRVAWSALFSWVSSAQLVVDVSVVVSWMFLTSLMHVLAVCQPVFHRNI